MKLKKTSKAFSKAFLCIYLSLSMLILSLISGASALDKNTITDSAASNEPVLGDVNSDGLAKLRDAILVQKYSLLMIDFNERQLLCGDVDKNSKVNLLDSIYIQKYALQSLSNSLGIGAPLRKDTVVLNVSEITLGVGESYTLIKSSPTGADLSTAVFSSDSKNIASVNSSSGTVKANKAGTATVTVTTKNGATASCRVTVRNAPTSVYLNKTALTLAVGEAYYLDCSFPIAQYAHKITYSSNKYSVATVASGTGLVTAKSVGTAVITAKTYNGKTASCTVTVRKDRVPNPVTENNIVSGMSRGGKRLSEVLGFDSNTYLNWLDNHDNDSSKAGYYIGTPFAVADCRVPNGAKGSVWGHADTAGKSGMNSAGFVWHVLYSACTSGKGDNPNTKSDGYFSGAHNGGKCQYYSPTGVKIPTLDASDGVSWYDMYSGENVKRYYFKTKSAMLKSGVLEKGDIIRLISNRTYNGKAAENVSGSLHHIGIYYPTTYNGKSVNFWHSGPDGGTDTNGWKTKSNSITQISGMTVDANIKMYVVIKV